MGDDRGALPDEHWQVAVAQVSATLDRIEATVRLLLPEDMTPNAARMFRNVIEDERRLYGIQ